MKRRGLLFAAILCFVVAGLLMALLIAINTARATPFEHERPADVYQPVVIDHEAHDTHMQDTFRYRR